MDLWIRSQDRETLMLANYFEIEQRDKNFLIMAGNGDPYFDQCLGLYKTKERALEILDEIQNLLVPKIKYTKGKINGSFNGVVIRNEDTMEIKEFSTFVYEMPKE